MNGIKIYYQIFNARGGDPVLLLHGGGASADGWGNQMPALMKTHRVIALDSRGHGRSTRDDQPYSHHLMATDVLATMDYLKLPKVAVFGWSDGGVIGLDLAVHHSERLTKLYLFGAHYNLTGAKPDADRQPIAAQIDAYISQEYARLSPTPDRFEDFLRAMNLMWSKEPDFKPDELRRIAVPTHVAHAEHDEFIQTVHAQEMARLIPGAKFQLLHGVSHFAPLQDPELFNRSLLAFFGSN